MKCSKCGTENRAEVKYCRNCGQLLILEQPETSPPEVTVVPSARPNTVCGVCGAAVKATALFCPRCGKELGILARPVALQQPVASKPFPDSSSSLNQPPSAYSPSPQHSSFTSPMEPPPTSVNEKYARRGTTSYREKQVNGRAQQSNRGWIWGALIGIIILIAILIVLTTIFIPKALKGTGLLKTKTPTAATLDQPSPTLTSTPSPTLTTEPTPTQEATVEPPLNIIPAVSVLLTTTPETISVGSQVVVTVSISNDSDEPILPLCCDLLGIFAPILKPAEGVTYTIRLPDTEPQLEPGANTIFVYLLDAEESGTTNLGASVLIGVGTPDHRQVAMSPVITLNIR